MARLREYCRKEETSGIALMKRLCRAADARSDRGLPAQSPVTFRRGIREK
jgi:hypothetical protein